MEQSAAPGTIQITGQTLALTRGIFQVESLGAIQAKGILEPVPAYRLIAIRSDRPPFASIGTPGSSRLIGRDREMAMLEHAFDLAAQGDGQIVAAVGEPGIGKSRLFQEFAQSQRLKSALVIACGGVSFRKDTPWAPIAELIRQYFAVSDEDPAESVIGRISSRVTAFDAAFDTL